ncbi:hypothetical protein CDS [Bradyrhizobium sp.]|uniref:hypothetical protein n=1 Tax=unclassified Bradyrhizobium TaxID=2631580 RepID=UPI0007C1D21C|nr:hypothetical protein [Bradyrhizobium sp.]CUU13823.1 hypothetical protein CDS [Bradyrhizobium sp.]
MPNRHPVDLLADIRAEIKTLRHREELLRAEVLDHPEDLAGDEHDAMICETMVERVDLELMKRELGLLFLRPFLRAQVQTSVRIKPTRRTRRTR